MARVLAVTPLVPSPLPMVPPACIRSASAVMFNVALVSPSTMSVPACRLTSPDPALIVATEMLPAVASSRMLPPPLVVVAGSVSSMSMSAAVATIRMVPAPAVATSAFWSTPLPAVIVTCPVTLLMSALMTTSPVRAASSTSPVPLALTAIPSPSVPSLAVIDDATTLRGPLLVVVRSSSAAWVLSKSIPVTVASFST